MNDNFDVIQYLEDRDIPYDSQGNKNVGKGWIGIQCPFLACGDHSRHLGINKFAKTFHCWICGENGNIIKLIKQLEGCTWREAEAITFRFTDFFNEERVKGHLSPNFSNVPPYKSILQGNKECILPPESSDNIPALHKNYLLSRNFDPNLIIKKYKLKAVYNIGKHRGRLIIPCYLDNKLISYLTRDVTGQSGLPYIDCPESEAVVPVKQTLYNIDRVINKTAILVEGVTDVWRLGDGTIASFTSNMTDGQKKLLVEKVKKIFVMYDKDAGEKALKLAQDLSPLLKVELILLDHGDPGDLRQDEANVMKAELLK